LLKGQINFLNLLNNFRLMPLEKVVLRFILLLVIVKHRNIYAKDLIIKKAKLYI